MIMSTRIQTLVVDDEAPARRLLTASLQAWPRISVVGEADDGDLALTMIRELRPDVVFLDVQLPIRNGFEVVAGLASDALPVIVFATAYDRYALRAFEVSACDYLLKPFDDQRLNAAIERAIDQHDRAGSANPAVRSLLHHVGQPEADQLIVRIDGRHLFLEPGEIDWIEASGKELQLHLGKTVITVREPLSRIEQRLPASKFVRVHRSAIVNRHRIREVQPWFRGEYVILLRDGSRIISGRHYRETIRTLLSGR